MTYDVIICCPGNPSSAIQSISLQTSINGLLQDGKNVGIRHASANNIYLVRNACLATQGFRTDQVPFEGTVYADYAKILWIDSDNIVSPETIKRILETDADIVAAWYRLSAHGNLSSCGRWSIWEGNPLRRWEIQPYMVDDMTRMGDKLIEVDYAGMGLMAVKKGVFEAIGYPWFKPWVWQWQEAGHVFCRIVTDDDGFCYRAKEKGFKVMVHTGVRIEHEKKVRL